MSISRMGRGQHLYPGNGSYDLDGFLERLRVNGYQGVIALEIKDPSLHLPAQHGDGSGVSNGRKAVACGRRLLTGKRMNMPLVPMKAILDTVYSHRYAAAAFNV